MEDVDWLVLLDLISWTGAWRFCRGGLLGLCCGFLCIQMLMLVVWIVRSTEKSWMFAGRQVGARIHVRKCSVLLLDETHTVNPVDSHHFHYCLHIMKKDNV